MILPNSNAPHLRFLVDLITFPLRFQQTLPFYFPYARPFHFFLPERLVSPSSLELLNLTFSWSVSRRFFPPPLSLDCSNCFFSPPRPAFLSPPIYLQIGFFPLCGRPFFPLRFSNSPPHYLGRTSFPLSLSPGPRPSSIKERYTSRFYFLNQKQSLAIVAFLLSFCSPVPFEIPSKP